MVSKSETDAAHHQSVAALHARLDAEQTLKKKVREEQRACFEDVARILGHKPPSPEEVKAAARRKEAIVRIAKLGEQAGFIGEASAKDVAQISGRPGSQVMDLIWPSGLKQPFDLPHVPPLSSPWPTVFNPPYPFKMEYPASGPVDGRGADRLSGKVFARSSSFGASGSLRALVGVRFSLPKGGPFGTPVPQPGGLPLPPPFHSSQARIVASIAGTKRWFFHAEHAGGEIWGDVDFFIWSQELYGLGKDWTLDEAIAPEMHWAMSPGDYLRPDWYTAFGSSADFSAPTALPTKAVSNPFEVDNYHSYDIYVGLSVGARGSWTPGQEGQGYAMAISELEAVIQSITIEFTY